METKITPMMQQWHACKEQAKEALLLFRLGDFYEAFYDDALILARDLELTLTKRAEIPMSGIPAQTLETYLEKLIQKGHLIAIAEQVEDPRQVKGIVKREIVRLLSPGTIYQSSLLSEKTPNFFGCVYGIHGRFGCAFLDITTADFRVIEVASFAELKEEILRFSPPELLLSEKFAETEAIGLQSLQEHYTLRLTKIPDWHFNPQHCDSFLREHFKVHHLEGFGLKGSMAAMPAAGALLAYLQEFLHLPISHILSLQLCHPKHFMLIDQMTEKHLEIVTSQHHKSSEHTLLSFLDHTLTPMGGRLMRDWVMRPLLSKETITSRLDATEELLQSPTFLTCIEEMRKIRDLERLLIRTTSLYGTPKDIAALKLSLEPIPAIKVLLSKLSHPLFKIIAAELHDLSALRERIEMTLVADPPLRIGESPLIRPGVERELDELRALKADSHTFLLQYQQRLRHETGLKTLKVGFNKAFGYFIEISRLQAQKVPPQFHKKQTLVNTERFITEELRDYEHKILHAEEKLLQLESSLYHALKTFVSSFKEPIQAIAKAIAHLDCLLSLAQLAKHKAYTRPIVDESDRLIIHEGRHPIIEALQPSLSFIPNDTEMNGSDQKLFVITGPNMAGKSTYIRQVALICIMAQIGCFVPARFAHIGLIDKIFSRIGASDDLSRGQSTFMVEMIETASILRNATSQSLVILDEIGRGTSTYDGIAIAGAVAEYLLTTPGKQAKTLFATHYSELTELERHFPGAVNYTIAVKEGADGIIFLRKILRGSTDKSYGIHVAKLAGLPQEVIQKANKRLQTFEKKGGRSSGKGPSTPPEIEQLSLFDSKKDLSSKEEQKILQELKTLDIHQMTPMQALSLIHTWKHSILN